MTARKKNRVYWVLFLANFLITLGFGMTDPFFPLYVSACGATGLHLALVFSGYAAAKALASPLIGWWSDRRGRRFLIIAGLGAYTAISLAYLAMPGPIVLILLRVLQGVAAALVRPVSLALVGDMAPEGSEGATMGTFDIAFYGALAIGPVLGGVIKDTSGFTGLFLCLFFLCLLSFAIALFFVADPGKAAGKAPHTEISILGRSRVLLGLCGFIFSRSVGIVICAVFLPLLMYDEYRFAGFEIGIIMGAATIVTTILLRPMGRLADRVPPRRLVVAGGFMTALMTFAIPFAHSFALLLALSVILGFFSVLSTPASSTMLVQQGNALGMGLTLGIFNAAMNLGAILAPLAGGIAMEFTGIKPLFFGAGITGVLGILFFMACNVKARVPE